MIHEVIFNNLIEVIDYIEHQGWVLQKTYSKYGQYDVINYGNNKIIYYPRPLHSPLFRGQNEFFEPCIPSFYRSQPDFIEEFIQKLKIEEFRIVASEHSAIKEDIDNNIFFDHIALAQHYGLKTEMLDITNNILIAAFFAVTKKVNDQFIPTSESDNPGVLYFIMPTTQTCSRNINIYPIGWQIFQRPSTQRAFGIDIKKGMDFNSIPGVFAYRFYHNREISDFFYNIFKGGIDLFPKEIFVEKSDQINKSKFFSQEAFDCVYKKSNTILSNKYILSELKKRGITIEPSSTLKFNNKELTEIKHQHESGQLTENLIAYSRLCCIKKKDNT